MGKVFLEFFNNENFLFQCKKCSTHISHTDYVVIRHIETICGECIGFTESINVLSYENPNYATYTYHGDFDMYDDNSILKETSKSYFLYCKNCLLFIGWKHIDDSSEKHILLKSKIM